MPGANPTYSGSGEDILLGILFKRKPNNHTYIDVGAHIPRFGSNSYLFYLKGWHGLLLEANEALIPELRRVRPKDTVLHAAVGTKRGEADFTVSPNPSISSLRDIEGTKTSVQVYTLEDCIEMLGQTPSFVSLDTEGTDEAILRSFNFKKYRPLAWCVETCIESEAWYTEGNKNTEIPKIMEANGYKAWADTRVNTIYVDILSA